jgi:hypothetical protein
VSIICNLVEKQALRVIFFNLWHYASFMLHISENKFWFNYSASSSGLNLNGYLEKGTKDFLVCHNITTVAKKKMGV